ncbi:MAG: helix-turn-helix domain-containing protein [Eubacteriales bacterium]|nr:helix-turn-helix domain-containing protein [Eubacteriales bacterium]
MIQVNLDVMMAKRKISLNELAKRMDLSLANLSILKNNKCRAIRFSTLSSLCEILNCEAGDILVYVKGDEPNGIESDAE